MAAAKKSTPKKQDGRKLDAPTNEGTPNGVAVIVGENGQLQVQTLGETRVTEAPTILRIAANNVEKGLIEQS